MKSTVADPKKYAAGWLIIGIAVDVGVYSYFRSHQEGVILSPLVALFGWSFMGDAKRKKEEPPHLPGLRWYHVLVVTVVVAASVVLIYRATV